MPVVAALLLGAAPWRMTEGFGDWLPAGRRVRRRRPSSRCWRLRGHPGGDSQRRRFTAASGIALIACKRRRVLVLAARVFMLVRRTRPCSAPGAESSRSLRDLANRDQRAIVPGLRPGRRGQVREPGGRGLRLPAWDADRLTAARLRPLPRTGPPAASVRLALLATPREPRGSKGSKAPAGSRSGSGPPTGRGGTSSPPMLRYQAPGEPVQMLVTARDVSDQRRAAPAGHPPHLP